MNQVSLLGRLTREPELHKTPGGDAVLRFTLAVNRRRKKDEAVAKADFIPCIAWRGKAETIAKFCQKGSRLGIVGALNTRWYRPKDADKDRFVMEVTVMEFSFADARPKEAGSNTDDPWGEEIPF